MAVATLDGWSFWITTSALSIAASEPSPPIAIPTWLSANTGASFIPSPTKATVLPGSSTISRICAALSSGNRFPYARSIPKRLAKEATISFLSPDSRRISVTPNFLSLAIASTASSFNVSDNSRWPAYFLSMAQITTVATWSDNSSGMEIPRSFIKRIFPTSTSCPPMTASTPCPASSCISDTLAAEIFCFFA